MQLSQVLLGPIVTEKAVRLQEANHHLFSVHAAATKIDVIQAIRVFYGVTPTAVRMMAGRSKVRFVTRSRFITKRKALKRAVVVLPPGTSLELLNVQKSTAGKGKKKTSSSSK